jgi:hypothetical protein
MYKNWPVEISIYKSLQLKLFYASSFGVHSHTLTVTVNHSYNDFFCVGVMYSGEYVCDVTLSVYPHLASLKNMPGHGGLSSEISHTRTDLTA